MIALKPKRTGSRSNRISLSKYILFFGGVLILVIFACTTHENPFDPNNEIAGKPFSLKVRTGYGKILLEWQWPNYPVEGSDPIPLDSFLVFRKGPFQSTDTLRPHLKTTWTDTAGITGDSIYHYQVAAFRGGAQSDLSDAASAFAYPLPMECADLGENLNNPDGIPFVVPRAIAFFGNLKYIAEGAGAFGGTLRGFDGNDQQFVSRAIKSPTSDLALVNTGSGDSFYLYVSSAKQGIIEVFMDNGLIKDTCTINLPMPQALAVAPAQDTVYIADKKSRIIFKVGVGKCKPDTTSMKTDRDPWKLTVLSNPPRLICADKGSNTVLVYDLTTESLLKRINVEKEPVDVWVGPDANLYVACRGAGKVLVIDLDTYGIIAEIPISDPVTTNPLSPISVTGYPDSLNRHAGVLAVLACTGIDCADPAYLFYYSIKDRKLQMYLKIPEDSSPLIAKMNTLEGTKIGRLYTLLENKIRVCQSK